MGKYRGLTKRRKQRAGALLDWKSLIPSGFPSSTADLKGMISSTVTGMPAIKTVSGAVGTISQVATSISSVSDTLTNLPTVVTESVQGAVEAKLAMAGIPAIGASGSANGASGSTNGASGSANGASGSNTTEQEGGASGSGPGDSTNTIDIEQFGGNRYELVTISRPISDPLFVYYKSGKPVYFTEGPNGVRILKNGHMTMGVKNKKKTSRRTHKR